jgi:hypothetical protein
LGLAGAAGAPGTTTYLPVSPAVRARPAVLVVSASVVPGFSTAVTAPTSSPSPAGLVASGVPVEPESSVAPVVLGAGGVGNSGTVTGGAGTDTTVLADGANGVDGTTNTGVCTC